MEMTFPVAGSMPARAPKSRVDWLVHFRKAVIHDTLDFMADRLWASLQSPKDKAEMWLAYGDRQQEIDNSQFVARRHA
nr:hypothetical protein [Raoultella planticola]